MDYDAPPVHAFLKKDWIPKVLQATQNKGFFIKYKFKVKGKDVVNGPSRQVRVAEEEDSLPVSGW